MKTPLLLLAFIPLLFACGNDTKTKQNQSVADKPTPESIIPPTYLEGVYATSTAPGSAVQNLFDHNTTTLWRTRPGAGPDEGIMLYFENPQALSSVEVVAEQGSFSEGKGAIIEIVGNGAIIGAGHPNGEISVDNKPVKSLFVHFQSTGKEVRETINDVVLDTYAATASVGVAELVLRSDKGEALRIVPPQRIQGTAVASSTLKPETAYNTANLFDGRKEFCWVEGNAGTAGEGETIKFTFNDPNINITALQIWNGYQRSDEHYESNARVRDFEITNAEGVAKTYTLRDTKAGQRIELTPALRGNACTLTIKSVYPGKRYKDLAISDILFFDGDRPFVLQTDFTDKVQSDVHARSGASPLTGLLDRRLANTENLDGTMLVQQSLILRSDGTFVLYTRNNDPNDESGAGEQKSFADGNWELIQADGNKASVRIFGQWTDVANLADYYKGASTQAFTRIFSDVLTIGKNKLSGAKMVGEFIFK